MERCDTLECEQLLAAAEKKKEEKKKKRAAVQPVVGVSLPSLVHGTNPLTHFHTLDETYGSQAK